MTGKHYTNQGPRDFQLSSSFDPGFNTFADRQMLLKSSQESFFIVVYIVDSKCRKYSFALL
jgi:hypothetical protein